LSNAYIHAERSAKKWGGEPTDYLAIHRWIDQVKSQVGDNRHRAVLHNAWGIHLAVDVFGNFITNSAGKRVFVKEIGEQHVIEDLGFIPSLSDCLAGLKLEPWLAGALARSERQPVMVSNRSLPPGHRLPQ
jgi:hypothetical protein